MSDKSTFYQIQLSLYSDERYKQLSTNARFALHALKGILPYSNIDVVFGLNEAVSYITKIAKEEVPAAIKELVDAGFVKRHEEVVWLVNGFKHHTNYSPNNVSWNKSVLRQVSEFKDNPLAKEFREKYAEVFEAVEEHERQEELKRQAKQQKRGLPPSPRQGDPQRGSSTSTSISTSTSTSTKKEKKTDKETWATPYMTAWAETFNAPDIMPVPPDFPPRFFRDLKPGHEKIVELGWSPQEIQSEFEAFLMTKMLDADLAYDRSFIEHNGEKFFQSFGNWTDRQTKAQLRFEERKEGGR